MRLMVLQKTTQTLRYVAELCADYVMCFPHIMLCQDFVLHFVTKMNRSIAHWGRKDNINIGLHKFEEMIYGHFLIQCLCYLLGVYELRIIR